MNPVAVVRWEVLYTKRKKQKDKRWQDGSLRVCTRTRKAKLFDTENEPLEDFDIKAGLFLEEGAELDFSIHLVQLQSISDPTAAPASEVHAATSANSRILASAPAKRVPVRSASQRKCRPVAEMTELHAKEGPAATYSGNGMSEERWTVLFTKHKTQKSKTQQDGELRVHRTHGGRWKAVLYDVEDNQLEERFLRHAEAISDGAQVDFENFLVSVEGPAEAKNADPVEEVERPQRAPLPHSSLNVTDSPRPTHGAASAQTNLSGPGQRLEQWVPLQKNARSRVSTLLQKRPPSYNKSSQLFNTPCRLLPVGNSGTPLCTARPLLGAASSDGQPGGGPYPALAFLLERRQPLKRSVSIPTHFPSLPAYSAAFLDALVEEVNLQLDELAKRFQAAKETAEQRLKKAPSCCHGLTKLLFSKTEKNFGRPFYKCPQGVQGCMFVWANVEGTKGADASAHVRTTVPQAELEVALRAQHIAYYSNCELTYSCRTSSDKFQTQWRKEKFVGRPAQHSEPFELQISSKDNINPYAMHDLWIVSSRPDFNINGPLGGFIMIAASSQHGPSRELCLGMKILSGNPPLKAQQKVYAIHGPSIQTELAMLEAVRSLSTSSFPVLPLLWQQYRPPAYALIDRVSSQKIVFKEPGSEMCAANTALQTILRFQLNEDQAKVLMVCAQWFDAKPESRQTSVADPAVCLVHGTFGAGKSHLLLALIVMLTDLAKARGDPSMRVVLSAATNIAVDRVLEGLLQQGFTDFLRIGPVKKVSTAVLPFCVHDTKAEDRVKKEMRERLHAAGSIQEKKVIRNEIALWKAGKMKERTDKLKAVPVLGVTCFSTSHPLLADQVFKVCLLDECSQMPEPLSLLPLAKFRCEKLVAVGDPAQLPPILTGSSHTGAEAEQPLGSRTSDIDGRLSPPDSFGLGRAMFVRLAEAGHEPVLLRTQYRCHPRVSAVASNLFYKGLLKDGCSEEDRPPVLPGLPPLVFAETSSEGQEVRSSSKSYSNEFEATLASRILDVLFQAGVQPNQIGVIVLYRAQAELVKSLLQRRGVVLEQAKGKKRKRKEDEGVETGVQVSTVDAFQGMEKDVIVLSCCRTNGLGFLASPHRLNVAISRAKRHLIIIGKSANLQTDAMWKQLLASIRSTPGSFKPVHVLLSSLQEAPSARGCKEEEATGCCPFSALPEEASTAEGAVCQAGPVETAKQEGEADGRCSVSEDEEYTDGEGDRMDVPLSEDEAEPEEPDDCNDSLPDQDNACLTGLSHIEALEAPANKVTEPTWSADNIPDEQLKMLVRRAYASAQCYLAPNRARSPNTGAPDWPQKHTPVPTTAPSTAQAGVNLASDMEAERQALASSSGEERPQPSTRSVPANVKPARPEALYGTSLTTWQPTFARAAESRAKQDHPDNVQLTRGLNASQPWLYVPPDSKGTTFEPAIVDSGLLAGYGALSLQALKSPPAKTKPVFQEHDEGMPTPSEAQARSRLHTDKCSVTAVQVRDCSEDPTRGASAEAAKGPVVSSGRLHQVADYLCSPELEAALEEAAFSLKDFWDGFKAHRLASFTSLQQDKDAFLSSKLLRTLVKAFNLGSIQWGAELRDLFSECRAMFEDYLAARHGPTTVKTRSLIEAFEDKEQLSRTVFGRLLIEEGEDEDATEQQSEGLCEMVRRASLKRKSLGGSSGQKPKRKSRSGRANSELLGLASALSGTTSVLRQADISLPSRDADVTANHEALPSGSLAQISEEVEMLRVACHKEQLGTLLEGRSGEGVKSEAGCTSEERADVTPAEGANQVQQHSRIATEAVQESDCEEPVLPGRRETSSLGGAMSEGLSKRAPDCSLRDPAVELPCSFLVEDGLAPQAVPAVTSQAPREAVPCHKQLHNHEEGNLLLEMQTRCSAEEASCTGHKPRRVDDEWASNTEERASGSGEVSRQAFGLQKVVGRQSVAQLQVGAEFVGWPGAKHTSLLSGQSREQVKRRSRVGSAWLLSLDDDTASPAPVRRERKEEVLLAFEPQVNADAVGCAVAKGTGQQEGSFPEPASAPLNVSFNESKSGDARKPLQGGVPHCSEAVAAGRNSGGTLKLGQNEMPVSDCEGRFKGWLAAAASTRQMDDDEPSFDLGIEF